MKIIKISRTIKPTNYPMKKRHYLHKKKGIWGTDILDIELDPNEQSKVATNLFRVKGFYCYPCDTMDLVVLSLGHNSYISMDYKLLSELYNDIKQEKVFYKR